jgi:hypothetical protein
MDTEQAETIGRELLATGHPADEIFAAWREGGLSILHSIQAWSHISGMSLRESKGIVHCSPAWSDLRIEHDRLHDELEKFSPEPSKSD